MNYDNKKNSSNDGQLQNLKGNVTIKDRVLMLEKCFEIEQKCKNILCNIYPKNQKLIQLPQHSLHNQTKFNSIGITIMYNLIHKKKRLKPIIKNFHKNIFGQNFWTIKEWFNWFNNENIIEKFYFKDFEKDKIINKITTFYILRNILSHINDKESLSYEYITKEIKFKTLTKISENITREWFHDSLNKAFKESSESLSKLEFQIKNNNNNTKS